MKVWLSFLTLAAAAVSLAQSSFTIVRPADGAKVRETVRLLFPKNAIPSNGYVGIYLGGKFLEAIVPTMGANYSFYDLNTKARGIPDGPLTIEAVLFADFSERPRIVDRSKIDVEVVNSASIPVPDAGLKLRYKFRPGTAWIYQVEQKVATTRMSEAAARNSSSAKLLTGADSEKVRLMYSVDNAYANGDGLVRIQPMVTKGRHSAVFTVASQDEPKKYEDYNMAPLYMRVHSTGDEVFGSVPRYFPLDGSPGGESVYENLYAAFPLPVLPTKLVKPGDPTMSTWQSRFQLGDLNLEKQDETNSIAAKGFLARGELVGVEWEMNHPCAHIRHSLSQRDPNASRSKDSMIVNAAKIEEDIYFALDLGAIVKMVREYQIEVKVQEQQQQAAGGGAAGGGQGPTAAGTATGGGTTTGGRGAAANVHNPGGKIEIKQRRQGGPGQRGGGPGQRGGGPSAGGTANGSGSGTGRTGGSGVVNSVVLQTIQVTFTLEK